MWSFLRRLLGRGRDGFDLPELAARLEMPVEKLATVQPRYRSFTIAKRAGGSRTICAPEDSLRDVQRAILHRVIAGLRAHPAAHGFERGRSIVTNARPHVAKAVVVSLDLTDFFPSTTEQRVRQYLTKIGWSRAAVSEIVRLTCHNGGLPQGAPTSPRLSNLVNYRLDARLAGLARSIGADYTRYADDITFSLVEDDRTKVDAAVHATRRIVAEFGYTLNERKLSVRRRHQRQEVTGLVVNERIALPRETRRWLRAVDHRLRTQGRSSLTDEELEGWLALVSMVHTQGRGTGIPGA